jgi:hypothetical protein
MRRDSLCTGSECTSAIERYVLPMSVSRMESPLKVALSLGRGLVLVAMVPACVATAHSVATPDDGVRTLLVREIRAKLAGSTFPATWDNSRLEISVSASGVVPGLRYHRGTYTVPELSHLRSRRWAPGMTIG